MDEFGAMGATATADGSDGTGGASAGTTGGLDDDGFDSSSGEGRLDLPNVDVLTVECESIDQNTDIEEGPADILVVADDGVSEQARIDAITNLLPYVSHVGVENARVIWITGPAPDHDDPDTECFGAQTWPCVSEGVLSGLPYWRHVEHEVSGGDILGSLLATESSWREFMRPNATKHVWVYSSTRRDDGLTVSDFDSAFSELGQEYLGYTFHAFIGDTAQAPNAGNDFAAFANAKLGHSYDPLDEANFQIELFFDAVLDGIRTAGLACEYEIPAAPDGQVFEKGHVNVEYDDGLGSQNIGYVEDLGDCASVEGAGWYYDDPVDPESIKMCPQTCARFEALQSASIEIVFGCATIPAG